jgi:hypothetical protein
MGIAMRKLALLALMAFTSMAHADVYQDIFDSVDQAQLQKTLLEMTGGLPVTIDGRSVSITNRYAPEMKALYRAYWAQYMTSLGLQVTELPYQTAHRQLHEFQGHNVEAVLPGASADSFIVIVHYDSIGPKGHETENPGVDDDMTGMAVALETARLLSSHAGHLQHTVRFVAVDYEEWGDPRRPVSDPGLEGSRKYAKYIQDLAAREGFKLIGAVDDEQCGWNCASDNLCNEGNDGKTAFFATCSPDGLYNYTAIGDFFQQVAAQYSDLRIDRDCEKDDSDHYAMWEIGVPAVIYAEPYGNPFYDGNGGDVYTRIDQDYFLRMAKLGVVFAAKEIGVN